VVLDGFGVAQRYQPNSTWNYAKRPTMEYMERYWPFTTLQASGVAVGLSWGEPGNSEVGHLTMGAGRVVFTHLPRIIVAIQDETFFTNQAFLDASAHVKENNSSLHLMGLFSSGSVHAYAEHLYALLEFAKRENIERVFLHLFTDGRDAPMQEAAKYYAHFFERIAQEYPFAKIVSLIGREYSMDRDGHWDRIQKTFDLFVEGAGKAFTDISSYIKEEYKAGFTDEFISPGFLADENGKAVGRMSDNDAVIFFNYREDSAREITDAIISDGFEKFKRRKLNNLVFVTMTGYDLRFSAKVAFPPLDIVHPLARVVSDAGLTQFHVAETDKYAHVTYFFNGGREKPYPGEERTLVASIKTDRYNETPEMSASKVTEEVISALGKYDFILVNFANADMVGHTGDFNATVKAIETLDYSLGALIPKVLESGGVMIVTADHGNAEEKIYTGTGIKRTKHTINPVPFFLVSNETKNFVEVDKNEIIKKYTKTEGMLPDVAPTVLSLLGLAVPKEMTGINLLPKLIK